VRQAHRVVWRVCESDRALDILRDLSTNAPAPAILVYKRGAGYLAPIEWPPTERTPSVGTVSSLPSE
jgi:hypothetical protein